MTPLAEHERMIRPERPPKAPTAWASIDAAVEDARVRVVALHERAREASDTARAAAEHVAEVERADRDKRAQALADGGEDAGRNATAIGRAEKAAAEAAERSAVVAAAVAEGHARLERVIEERREPWEAAARALADEAASEFREAVASVEAAYASWREACGQIGLATDERLRRKSGVGADVTLPELRDRAGQPMHAGVVLAALRGATGGREVEPDDEPETMTVEDRRAFVAEGGEVEVVGRRRE